MYCYIKINNLIIAVIYMFTTHHDRYRVKQVRAEQDAAEAVKNKAKIVRYNNLLVAAREGNEEEITNLLSNKKVGIPCCNPEEENITIFPWSDEAVCELYSNLSTDDFIQMLLNTIHNAGGSHYEVNEAITVLQDREFDLPEEVLQLSGIASEF